MKLFEKVIMFKSKGIKRYMEKLFRKCLENPQENTQGGVLFEWSFRPSAGWNLTKVRPHYKCLHVNFPKFLRADFLWNSFLYNTSGRLLVNFSAFDKLEHTGFNLATRDLYFRILVDVFTNHFIAKNISFTNHIKRTKLLS